MKNSVAIHQAHFLPWLPYFSLLSSVEAFVVLDNIQYKPRYFINRTKIVCREKQKLQWISVPNNGTQSDISRDVNIIRDRNYKKFINKVTTEYRECKHYAHWKYFEEILNDPSIYSLVSLNVKLIKTVFKLLEIRTPTILYSSNLLNGVSPNCRTHRFKLICDKTNSNKILAGVGKSGEVHDIEALKKNGISFKTMKIESLTKNSITEGLSIIDSLLCKGVEETRGIVSSVSKEGYAENEGLI